MSGPRMPRLVLLNGLPGAGKSTLARRYLRDHPGVLCVDPDLLRGWIGGDPDDHAETSRGLALALGAAHLATGHDVLVPQLVARVDQVDRFARTASEAGAGFAHIVLQPTGEVVESRVPDAAVPHLIAYAEGLAEVCLARPVSVLRLPVPDLEPCYVALRRLLDAPH